MNGFEFGMGSGVVSFLPPIPAPADDPPVRVGDHTAHRDLALRGCVFREAERLMHGLFSVCSAHNASPTNIMFVRIKNPPAEGGWILFQSQTDDQARAAVMMDI